MHGVVIGRIMDTKYLLHLAKQLEEAASALRAVAAVQSQVTPAIRDDLRIPIRELGLSTRATKGLVNTGIEMVGDLIPKTPSDLEEIKNFGQSSLQEVRERLDDMGLRLTHDPSR
jgi:DNA-directed RNA polymerase alpha subunit